MRDFKNVLVVHGNSIGSDDALVQGAAIAAGSRARLTVAAPPDPSMPCTPQAIREMKARLRRLEPWIAKEGVIEFSTDVLCGTPHVEIVRRVLNNDHDLVVVSEASWPSIWDRLRPSIAAQLRRHCPCPVLFIEPGQAASIHHVLAAIELGAESFGDERLNRRIIAAAAALAASRSAQLHVVHCWQPAKAEHEMLQSEIRDEVRHAIIDRNEARHRNQIRALLDRYAAPDQDAHIHLPRGHFPNAAVDVAAREGVDVVVVGADSSDGIFGATSIGPAEDVRRRFSGAVLAVKSDRFQSPVVQAARETVAAGPRLN